MANTSERVPLYASADQSPRMVRQEVQFKQAQPNHRSQAPRYRCHYPPRARIPVRRRLAIVQ
eukprot:4055630-Pyramimonas_sp.AAC.1